MAKKRSSDEENGENQAEGGDDQRTEQEKHKGEGVPGVGPAGKAEPSPGPATTIEEQNIGPRTPYPEGGGVQESLPL